MSDARSPDVVLLVVAVFSRHVSVLDWARQQLEQLYGPVALASRDFDFHHTRYYEPTMGPGLRKRFLAFRDPVPPGCLPEIKLRTIEMERELAESGAIPRPGH